MIPRIRTIDKAYKIIKHSDPETAISKYAFTKLVKEGVIPCQKSGVKVLVDVDLAIMILQKQFSVESGDFNDKRHV